MTSTGQRIAVYSYPSALKPVLLKFDSIIQSVLGAQKNYLDSLSIMFLESTVKVVSSIDLSSLTCTSSALKSQAQEHLNRLNTVVPKCRAEMTSSNWFGVSGISQQEYSCLASLVEQAFTNYEMLIGEDRDSNNQLQATCSPAKRTAFASIIHLADVVMKIIAQQEEDGELINLSSTNIGFDSVMFETPARFSSAWLKTELSKVHGWSGLAEFLFPIQVETSTPTESQSPLITLKKFGSSHSLLPEIGATANNHPRPHQEAIIDCFSIVPLRLKLVNEVVLAIEEKVQFYVNTPTSGSGLAHTNRIRTASVNICLDSNGKSGSNGSGGDRAAISTAESVSRKAINEKAAMETRRQIDKFICTGKVGVKVVLLNWLLITNYCKSRIVKLFRHSQPEKEECSYVYIQ